MPFRWKTEYEKTMPADGLTNWQIFAIAQEVCKKLEWEYLVVDENTFTATTPTNWTLNEEIITIQPHDDKILFKSKSESIELVHAGRNQKNIEEELLPAFKKAKEAFRPEELQNNADTLKNETLKQVKSGNRIAAERMSFGFRDHEVTFSLIFIQLALYVVMMAKGVYVNGPALEDIIKWGGSIRLYVTGGEWWRLLTAIFVHISLLHLLVNMAALYFIGLLVESVLGKVKFLIAFLCAGILANLVAIMWFDDTVTAGSSGAIFGLYGVFLAFATTAYINRKFPKVWLLSIVAYVVFSVYLGSGADLYNVLNFTGLVAGICIAYLFYLFHFRRKLARAGGTRISIEILLATSLLAFLYIRNQRDDSIRFEKAVMKLNQIEVKAMTQMQRLQYAASDEEAAKMIKDSTLPEWQHFQTELNKTDKYRLDDEFSHKRKLLSQYANMRVHQTQLIYNSFVDGSTKYDQQIQAISDSIDRIIDQLGY